tara:strand:+ start:156 stop:1259 length:1104 start_codon:yes stop_codon:yes gene_type:complete
MWTLFRGISLLLLSTSVIANIGLVTNFSGSAAIERDEGFEVYEVEKDLGVEMLDVIATAKGKVQIDFLDDTRVDVTEHSRLVIDDFVYDPASQEGSLSLKASLGTIRYASGQIAKNSKQNVKITTPSAVIGVRGTDFTMTVDEIGGSTIILLPSCDTNGDCFVGEISVESDAGMVIMNQAFQATTVSTSASVPLKPVILDLDENLINNLLIISKPRAIAEAERTQELNKVATALDIDFLKFDELDVDLLAEEEDELANSLDTDFLAQNFLGNVLDQLNLQLALQMRSQFDKKKTSGDITLGKDAETGITILDEDPEWYWHRESASGSVVEFRLEKENSYIMNIVQGDFELIDFELGGTESEINIIQN